jgi:hypothetical protein
MQSNVQQNKIISAPKIPIKHSRGAPTNLAVSAKTNPFDFLPTELMLELITKLPLQTLGRLALVNRRYLAHQLFSFHHKSFLELSSEVCP